MLNVLLLTLKLIRFLGVLASQNLRAMNFDLGPKQKQMPGEVTHIRL